MKNAPRTLPRLPPQWSLLAGLPWTIAIALALWVGVIRLGVAVAAHI